jgi:Cu/Ag efflux pump CusA
MGLLKTYTMINQLISLSLKNRYIVLLIAIALFAWGAYAVSVNPIDAIPFDARTKPARDKL